MRRYLYWFFPHYYEWNIICFPESNCYLDQSKYKLLSGSFDEFEDNSPSSCVKNCAGNGFMLAGVENGNGCYCGDEMPDDR